MSRRNSRNTRPGRGFGTPFVPRVEALEGRDLPSAFTVLNLDDGGVGSLRDAIAAAEANPGPDTIDFTPGLQGTITLTGGELQIRGDAAITGPGADRITVSGNGASRVFRVIGGIDAGTATAATISGLTISHGLALSGGGVRNEGFSDLTLSHVVLTDNRAIGGPTPNAPAWGGGVLSNGLGTHLSVIDSLVASNTADGRPNGRPGLGGGIAVGNGGRLTMLGSTVADNLAVGGVGGIGRGAGVDIIVGSGEVRDCTFRGNAAIGGTGQFISGAGGGLRVTLGDLVVDRCVVSGNRAVGGFNPSGFGYYAFGGGIDVSSSSAVITGCTLDDNEAVAGDGLLGGWNSDGGAMRVFISTATVTDTRFTNNRSLGTNGGNGQGGAILVAVEGEVFLNRCTLTGNEAIGGDGGIDGVGQGTGGAIALFYDSSATITDSHLSNNRAVGGSGNSVTGFDVSVGPAFGGAISNAIGCQIDITRSVFRGNEAIGGSNTFHDAPNAVDAGSAHGGAITTGTGAIAVIRDSVIERNRAVGGNNNRGIGPTGTVGSATGGGIDNVNDGIPFGEGPTTLTVINCTIAHNEAIGGDTNTASGGDVFVGAGLGGGLSNSYGSTADVSGSRLTHNKAVGGKGNSTGGSLPVNLGAGGAVFNAYGNFVWDGLLLAPSVVTLRDCTVAHNQARGGPGAGGWGGGVANMLDADTTVTGGTLSHNLALGGPGGSGYGGGAFNDETSRLALWSGTVTGNHANGDAGVGGGVYNRGTFTLDTLAVVTGNHASTSDDDVFGDFDIVP